MTGRHQTTLKASVSCTGLGLHSGKPVTLVLQPAPAESGICFRRADVTAPDAAIPARYDLVSSTQLGTNLTNASGVSLATVEHLMAALVGTGVDNCRIDVHGPEIPIMDGSSAPFVFLIDCAGITDLPAARRMLRVVETVEIVEGEKRAALLPSDEPRIAFEIDFKSAAIGRQSCDLPAGPQSFRAEIARARTFGFRHEVDQLKAMGLALGGSLDNAIVIDGDKMLNEGGLRYANEFVRHKALDAVGDLALAGFPFLGRYEGVRAGHALNNRLLRKLFATPGAFRIEPAAGTEDRLPAAAD